MVRLSSQSETLNVHTSRKKNQTKTTTTTTKNETKAKPLVSLNKISDEND